MTAEDEINTEEKVTLWKKIKNYMRGKNNDGLTTKQRLAKMGLNAVLSYGWVSNMSYCVSVSLAWYIFSKRVRQTHIQKLQFHRKKRYIDCPWTISHAILPPLVVSSLRVCVHFHIFAVVADGFESVGPGSVEEILGRLCGVLDV
jgi:hypothetical protein